MFHKELVDRNLIHMLDSVSRSKFTYRNSEKLYDYLDDIVYNGKRVLVDIDYDLDGGFCGVICKEFFDFMQVRTYTINKLVHKRHSIDDVTVMTAIREKYDYIVIVDSSSDEMNKIRKLCSFGVKPIIIDHHQSEYSYTDYPEECCIINSRIEFKEYDIPWEKVSAGALTFLVIEDYLKRLNVSTPYSLMFYGLVTLYSDSCDMSNEFNRAYYLECMSNKQYLPELITCMMSEYEGFNRRYIEFNFAPKINALFRLEQFDLLEKFLFNFKNMSGYERAKLQDQILKVYEFSSDLKNKAFDLIEHRALKNFVVGDLGSVIDYVGVPINVLANFTGLVANMLGEKYGKTAFVYLYVGDQKVNGSVRDLYSRNYLEIFKQFCTAGGHNSAFGVRLSARDFDKFLDILVRIDDKFSLDMIENNPIITNWDVEDVLDSDLASMALYNEFAGSTTPLALIRKTFTLNMEKRKFDYSYYIYWNNRDVRRSFSSPTSVEVGDIMTVVPIFGKDKIKLKVINVNSKSVRR